MKDLETLLESLNAQEILSHPFPSGIYEVNLKHLEHNLNFLRETAEKKAWHRVRLLLPVKANAYGSGMIAVSKFVSQKKLVDMLGVAHVGEAFALRKEGIIDPILVFSQGVLCDEEIAGIITYDIHKAVQDTNTLLRLSESAMRLGKKAKIHLKVDTWMGRVGIFPHQIHDFLEAIAHAPWVELTGVMTHLSVSECEDEENMEYTRDQIQRLKEIQFITKKAFPNQEIIFHASNSGGIFLHAEGIFDMIRPWIASYWYGEKPTKDLKPIQEIYTYLGMQKVFEQDQDLWYGRRYHARAWEIIGIIPLGYADGLNRKLTNKLQFAIHWEYFSSVGTVSMDQTMVSFPSLQREGSKVVVLSNNPFASNSAYALAKICETITYEILCSFGNAPRIRHQYIYQDEDHSS